MMNRVFKTRALGEQTTWSYKGPVTKWLLLSGSLISHVLSASLFLTNQMYVSKIQWMYVSMVLQPPLDDWNDWNHEGDIQGDIQGVLQVCFAMGSAALSLLDELLQLWPLPEQGGKLLTSDTPRVRSGHPFWSFLILSAFSSSCDNLWLCYFLDLAKWTKRTPTFPKQILCPCPSHVLAGYELVKVLATNSQLCKCKRLSWMGALPCGSKSATSSMQCWVVHCRVTSWHVFGPLGRHINLMLLTTVTWHSLKVKSSMWKKNQGKKSNKHVEQIRAMHPIEFRALRCRFTVLIFCRRYRLCQHQKILLLNFLAG